jgi:hypothetical protein
MPKPGAVEEVAHLLAEWNARLKIVSATAPRMISTSFNPFWHWMKSPTLSTLLKSRATMRMAPAVADATVLCPSQVARAFARD